MASSEQHSTGQRIGQILSATTVAVAGTVAAVYAANRLRRHRQTQDLLDSLPPATNVSAEDSQEEPDLALKPDVDERVDPQGPVTDDAPSDQLEALTVEELYLLAQERDIIGRSNMRKAELIDALRAKEAN
ncbi:hypothetical protein GCM10009720_00450 [Yaniella flava]|uniref:Rho termination factor-like N-terminal domain-containing protein n=1 Tax=Yaniella flava TaxID=287930 RepID=A0ABN2TZN6_9MICC